MFIKNRIIYMIIMREFSLEIKGVNEIYNHFNNNKAL